MYRIAASSCFWKAHDPVKWWGMLSYTSTTPDLEGQPMFEAQTQWRAYAWKSRKWKMETDTEKDMENEKKNLAHAQNVCDVLEQCRAPYTKMSWAERKFSI